MQRFDYQPRIHSWYRLSEPLGGWNANIWQPCNSPLTTWKAKSLDFWSSCWWLKSDYNHEFLKEFYLHQHYHSPDWVAIIAALFSSDSGITNGQKPSGNQHNWNSQRSLETLGNKELSFEKCYRLIKNPAHQIGITDAGSEEHFTRASAVWVICNDIRWKYGCRRNCQGALGGDVSVPVLKER